MPPGPRRRRGHEGAGCLASASSVVLVTAPGTAPMPTARSFIFCGVVIVVLALLDLALPGPCGGSGWACLGPLPCFLA
jgi:hypothetical protein